MNNREINKKILKIFGVIFGVLIVMIIIGGIVGEDSQPEKKSEQEQQQGTPEQVQQEEPEPQLDNIKYKTVKMPDGKIWFAENLNEAIGNSPCYENKEENCEKCGRLYDWETAMKACPKGWHLPSQTEWENLKNATGGTETAGGNLKSKSGWSSIRDGSPGNGTDKYGFSAISCGEGYTTGRFKFYGTSASLWSATVDTDTTAFITLFVGYSAGMGGPYTGHKSELYSVRCVKDN